MPWPGGNYVHHGVVQVSLHGRLHSQQVVNTFWFTAPGELANPDWPAKLQQLALAVLECAITHLLPGLSSQYTLENCRAKLMSVADKIEHIEPAPANSVGALGESLPSYCAATVTLYTPYSGDTRRGGLRIGAIPEANASNSQVTGPTAAQIVAFIACMLGKFKFDTGTDNGWDWIIFSRKNGFTAPSTYSGADAAIAPVVRGVVRTNLGTQNSRKLNRGS